MTTRREPSRSRHVFLVGGLATWLSLTAHGPLPAGEPSEAPAPPAESPAAASPPPRFDLVPGVVIDHSPAASRSYIGSPSITVLPSGAYVASHDFFGPGSGNNRTAVFQSADRGQSWRKLTELEGQWWSTLFVHGDALYILGTTTEYGNPVLRRSLDGGQTWTTPADGTTGLLREDGQYHCAPMPVLEHNGRLWRGMERRDPPLGWGRTFCAGMLSAPAGADLLDAASWTWTNFLPGNAEWLNGTFGGWLEGNAVVSPDGQVLNILRVDTVNCPEKAALVRISNDGRTASFDPQAGFVDFPGGAKKFTIRLDGTSKLYWSLATLVPERHQRHVPGRRPGSIRNTLALTCSPDLKNWAVRCVLLYHPDVAAHGFQYVDWLIDGDDLIFVCRTAYDDGLGGAHNNHDANFLTFHRVPNFRAKTPTDSVPMTVPTSETADFTIMGYGWTWKRLADDEVAFANRPYVWQQVPAAFRGWSVTQTSGGVQADIIVRAKRDATLHLATAPAQPTIDLTGWTAVPDSQFHYTDTGQTSMTVYRRAMKAGEELVVPQGTWTGALVLMPPAPSPVAAPRAAKP